MCYIMSMKRFNISHAFLVFIIVSVSLILALAVIHVIDQHVRGSAFGDYSIITTEFPIISEQLSETRQTILMVARREYESPQPPETYTTGNWEPWCADFVSYVYKEAGYPFSNPNSGSWRIPGIYTLRDYFVATGRWRAFDSYVPEPGDIVIYDGGVFGGHTNLVIATDGDEIITLGGNENDKINLMRFDYRDPQYGIQGFGVPPE